MNKFKFISGELETQLFFKPHNIMRTLELFEIFDKICIGLYSINIPLVAEINQELIPIKWGPLSDDRSKLIFEGGAQYYVDGSFKPCVYIKTSESPFMFNHAHNNGFVFVNHNSSIFYIKSVHCENLTHVSYLNPLKFYGTFAILNLKLLDKEHHHLYWDSSEILKK